MLAIPRLSQSYSTFFMGEDNEVWRFANRRLSRISLVSGEEVQYSLPFRPYFCAETNGGDLWLSDGSHMGVFNTVLRRYMDVPVAVAAADKLASSPLNSVLSVGSDRILFNTVSGAYYLYDAQAETVIEGLAHLFHLNCLHSRILRELLSTRTTISGSTRTIKAYSFPIPNAASSVRSRAHCTGSLTIPSSPLHMRSPATP